MNMTTNAMPIVANTNPWRFGLVRSRVVPGNCAAGRAVVGPVFRLISGAVDVWGSRLVSISLDTGPEPNFAFSVSPLNEPESLMSATPSVRQKASASSASTRLHWGQRFIWSLRVAVPFNLGFGLKKRGSHFFNSQVNRENADLRNLRPRCHMTAKVLRLPV